MEKKDKQRPYYILFEKTLIVGKNRGNTWKLDTLKQAARLVEMVNLYTLKNENISSHLKTLRAHWIVVHEAVFKVVSPSTTSLTSLRLMIFTALIMTR